MRAGLLTLVFVRLPLAQLLVLVLLRVVSNRLWELLHVVRMNVSGGKDLGWTNLQNKVTRRTHVSLCLLFRTEDHLCFFFFLLVVELFCFCAVFIELFVLREID